MPEDTIYKEMNLFNFDKEYFKVNKKLRVIEFFAGVGAQFKALKQLTPNVESWKTCEWAFNSIVAYNAVHHKDTTDYSKDKSKEEMIQRIYGISVDYNNPLSMEQLNKKPIEWIRQAYNCCIANHNLVNIMNVHGKDLEIVDKDKYCYLLSYSFPCQDLSAAGKRRGCAVSQAEGGTRSGLLWEVERILCELAGGGSHNLPDILLMENVEQLCQSTNAKQFEKWQSKLQELGYSNYCEILNSKDYGIPQNRKRAFMISILGDYAYDFPTKIPLKHKLEDMLETNVPEKYYLSKQHIEQIQNWNAQQKPLENCEKTSRGDFSYFNSKRGRRGT